MRRSCALWTHLNILRIKNVPELLDQLTLTWFWPAATAGIALGYIGRVVDHAVWASGPGSGQTKADVVRFALMIVPLCATFGFALGYALTVATAYLVHSPTVVKVASFAAPAFTSFLATELRDLLRRVWQKAAA